MLKVYEKLFKDYIRIKNIAVFVKSKETSLRKRKPDKELVSFLMHILTK